MTIHANLPIPPKAVPPGFRAKSGPRPSKYELEKLGVGDAKATGETEMRKVQASLSRYKKHNPNVAFTSRTMEGGEVYVWRTA